MICIHSGTLGIFEEDRDFELSAGESLLLWPGRQHGGTLDYPADLSFFWGHFYPNDTTPAWARPLRTPQCCRVRRPENLTTLYRRLLADQESGELTALQADLLMTLLLAEVSDDRSSSANNHSAQTILANQARKYIFSHIHEPLSAGSVAAALRRNPDYLGRAFKNVFGRTLTDEIHHCRLQLAIGALCNTERNIQEIALACGFDDPAYFRRLFRRREGMSPSAYRQLYARVHFNTE